MLMLPLDPSLFLFILPSNLQFTALKNIIVKPYGPKVLTIRNCTSIWICNISRMAPISQHMKCTSPRFTDNKNQYWYISNPPPPTPITRAVIQITTEDTFWEDKCPPRTPEDNITTGLTAEQAENLDGKRLILGRKLGQLIPVISCAQLICLS